MKKLKIMYQDLAREVGKRWSVRAKVFPVVVVLGSLRLNDNLRTIEVGIS